MEIGVCVKLCIEIAVSGHRLTVRQTHPRNEGMQAQILS